MIVLPDRFATCQLGLGSRPALFLDDTTADYFGSFDSVVVVGDEDANTQQTFYVSDGMGDDSFSSYTRLRAQTGSFSVQQVGGVGVQFPAITLPFGSIRRLRVEVTAFSDGDSLLFGQWQTTPIAAGGLRGYTEPPFVVVGAPDWFTYTFEGTIVSPGGIDGFYELLAEGNLAFYMRAPNPYDPDGTKSDNSDPCYITRIAMILDVGQPRGRQFPRDDIGRTSQHPRSVQSTGRVGWSGSYY